MGLKGQECLLGVSYIGAEAQAIARRAFGDVGVRRAMRILEVVPGPALPKMVRAAAGAVPASS